MQIRRNKKRFSKSWWLLIQTMSARTSTSAVITLVSRISLRQSLITSKRLRLAPDYSTAFNILGYAYRQNEAYSDAENAFKKYIELIPNDPNPYDSYAELLLKMGRFDEAITQYNKALAIDPNFLNSHFGIAAALAYQGKASDAQAELQKMTQKARSDGERRTALFGQMVVALDSGKLDQALAEVEKQYALGEKNNDVPAMTGDLQLKGNILLEMGKIRRRSKGIRTSVEDDD